VSDCPTDVLDLQVTAHRPDARVITVTGELDLLTAPDLAAVWAGWLA
jgi:hypothetical protein